VLSDIYYFQANLRPNGCVVLKENIASGTGNDFDAVDNSLTRPHQTLLSLFSDANVDVIVDQRQKRWPKDMYAVRMFVLRPKVLTNSSAV
jgi:protein N-terminal methyltransferase